MTIWIVTWFLIEMFWIPCPHPFNEEWAYYKESGYSQIVNRHCTETTIRRFDRAFKNERDANYFIGRTQSDCFDCVEFSIAEERLYRKHK